jgi:hypothetical protein
VSVFQLVLTIIKEHFESGLSAGLECRNINAVGAFESLFYLSKWMLTHTAEQGRDPREPGKLEQDSAGGTV